MTCIDDVKIYIKAVRVNAKMSQTEWGRKLGVDKATVCSWEQGKTKPNAEQLRVMSELSNIPIQFIFLPEKLNKV